MIGNIDNQIDLPEVSPIGRLWVLLREVPVRPARRFGAEDDLSVVLFECIHDLSFAVKFKGKLKTC